MSAPNKEVKSNLGTTTLNGAINNSVTSLTLTSATSFPATGNFRILIDSEIMLATEVAGAVLTVVRGAEGTTAASHSNGATVRVVATAGGLDQVGKDLWPVFGYGQPVNKLAADDGSTILTASDFTWVNQGGASATDQNGTILLRVVKSADIQYRVLARSHTAPKTYIAGFQMTVSPDDTGGRNHGLGLGFRNNSNGRWTVIMVRTQPPASASQSLRIACAQIVGTSPASISIVRAENSLCLLSPTVWLKVQDDNTNLKFSVGMDSENWIELYSEARTSHITSGPDQVCFYGISEGTDAADGLFRLVHWSSV